MKLSKFLRSSVVRINTEKSCLEDVNSDNTFPFTEIDAHDWGYIYEKYVGQIYEAEGYVVTYHGLQNGFMDQGIDLIATKDETETYIQCKYWNKKITKSHIEWLLYKASKILHGRSETGAKKVIFVLVTNNKELNFSRKIPKGFQLTFTDRSKIKFPLLQYFLDHNHIQNKVRLEYREIPMLL